jgi:hypothetical protein
MFSDGHFSLFALGSQYLRHIYSCEAKWERLFRPIGKIFNSEILKSILEMFQKKICDKDVWIASQIFSYGPYSSLRLDIQVVARPPASLTQLLLLYPGFRYDLVFCDCLSHIEVYAICCVNFRLVLLVLGILICIFCDHGQHFYVKTAKYVF